MLIASPGGLVVQQARLVRRTLAVVMVAGLLMATPMPANAGVGDNKENNCLRSEYQAIGLDDSLHRVKRILDGPGVVTSSWKVWHERTWGLDDDSACTVSFVHRRVSSKSRSQGVNKRLVELGGTEINWPIS